MSKKTRSSLSFENPLWPTSNYQIKYSVELPNSDGKYDGTDFTSDSILDVLAYCYGLDEFIIKSDKGMYFQFKASDYSYKQCHNAGFIEPFDFVTHNFLTAWELDSWKIMVRSSEDF